MRLVPLEQVNLPHAPVVDAHERVVAEDRPRDRAAGDAEVGLDVADQLERVFAHAITLVDEREDRRAPAFADLEQLTRPLFHPSAVVEQHDRAVGGDERAVRVLGEILVARRIEQVDLVAVVLELHDARRDRDTALLLELHPVARRVPLRPACLDGAGEVNGPAVEKELFGQRGFPGIRVTDDGERPAAADRVLEFSGRGRWGCVVGFGQDSARLEPPANLISPKGCLAEAAAGSGSVLRPNVARLPDQ